MDQAIFLKVQAGDLQRPLPIYGCALSRQLRKMIDPLSWKYLNKPREESE